MNKYQVIVVGRNLHILDSSQNPEKQGFRVTVLVEASDVQEAERIALDKVEHPSNPKMWSPLDLALNQGDPHDKPHLHVEDVTEDNSLDLNNPPHDFYWFVEKGGSES